MVWVYETELGNGLKNNCFLVLNVLNLPFSNFESLEKDLLLGR